MMPIHNSDVARVFDNMADLLEIEGANRFRVRAYRNAARTVSGMSRRVSDMVASDEPLTALQGIGKDLAGSIEEIVATGKLAALKELEQKTSPELNELMKIPGLGPKRVRVLFDELGITDREALESAAKKHEIRRLHGFGEKTEQKILREIKRENAGGGKRYKPPVAHEVADALVAYLEESGETHRVTVAGSFRRRCETVGDLDILVTCERGKASNVMKRFVDYEDVERVVSRGKTKSTVILRSGLQVDLRVLPRVSYGAAVHYFTGSKAHNIAVRKLGMKKGLKINEYGVFDEDENRIAGKTEEEIFEQVDLPYIEPELREDRGEIDAAQQGKLPHLVTLEDIRGDLHAHTDDTDGRSSLEEMVEAARKRGYDYLAVTNHSQHLTVAGGLGPEALAKLIEKIDKFNDELKDFRVLKAIEVDILEDGSLDLPDSILKELDLTVCSVHYKFNLSRDDQTERILRAMDNPYFHILGHPTGRLIQEREPYELDVERLMEGAREKGCFMELNANPDRLDLDDRYCRMAKEHGVKVAVSTDAHSIDHLDFIRYGIWQARRGWLEPDDVLNARQWKDLKKLLQRT